MTRAVVSSTQMTPSETLNSSLISVYSLRAGIWSCSSTTGPVQSFGLFFMHAATHAGNAENWLRKYEEQEWDVEQRGAFPFDSRAWLWEKWTRKDVCSTCSPMQ